MQLVRPGSEHLSGYVAALERGWSADNERGQEATREELARIKANAVAFLDSMEDRDGKGSPVTLPDGSVAKVEFFSDNLKIGDGVLQSDGSYSFDWINPPLGLPMASPIYVAANLMPRFSKGFGSSPSVDSSTVLSPSNE